MQINESSFIDLYLSTIKAFPKTKKRQNAVDPVVVEQLRWIPFKGVKTLFIKGFIRNESKHYNTIILFKNINYNKNEVRIIASDNLKYNFGKISLENNDMMIRCNCKDFYYRFNYYNHLDKSLYGVKMSKYYGEGNKPANPLELPGMCKHIIATAKVLKDSGLFLD